MFKTETETGFSSTTMEHLPAGLDSFQRWFLPYQLESWKDGESQLLKRVGQCIEQESLPAVKGEGAQNIGINAFQGDCIHADKSLLQGAQMEVTRLQSTCPPPVFERDRFETVRHQSAKMKGQDVQSVIDEYLLQPAPTLSALLISGNLLLKEPLLTSAEERVRAEE